MRLFSLHSTLEKIRVTSYNVNNKMQGSASYMCTSVQLANISEQDGLSFNPNGSMDIVNVNNCLLSYITFPYFAKVFAFIYSCIPVHVLYTALRIKTQIGRLRSRLDRNNTGNVRSYTSTSAIQSIC